MRQLTGSRCNQTEVWILSASCSFLDQIGSEESSRVSPSLPAASEPDGSDTDVLAVRPTNITDLIHEAYEVRKDEVILKVCSFLDFTASVVAQTIKLL